MAAAARSTQAGGLHGNEATEWAHSQTARPLPHSQTGPHFQTPEKKLLGFVRLELPEPTTCLCRAFVEWKEGGGGGGSPSDTTHQLSPLSRPPPAGKARKMVEGFEEAVEKNEAEEKLEQQKRQFPGLAMPDNTDRVMKLLKPETADTKIATEAMGEVSWGAGPRIRTRGLLEVGGLLLGDQEGAEITDVRVRVCIPLLCS